MIKEIKKNEWMEDKEIQIEQIVTETNTYVFVKQTYIIKIKDKKEKEND